MRVWQFCVLEDSEMGNIKTKTDSLFFSPMTAINIPFPRHNSSRKLDKQKENRPANSPRKISSTTILERFLLPKELQVGKYSTTLPARWYFPPCCDVSVPARRYKTVRLEPGPGVRRVFSLFGNQSIICLSFSLPSSPSLKFPTCPLFLQGFENTTRRGLPSISNGSPGTSDSGTYTIPCTLNETSFVAADQCSLLKQYTYFPSAWASNEWSPDETPRSWIGKLLAGSWIYLRDFHARIFN